ncbi:hypothetical protein ATSB10_12400 [Dyella thiooxydans]|uniref:Uncharacterized protein n=1 Tax=Dyella thiooxydans TaxID=445710 RepID=A0A160MZV7_9GAMM|nr:hypothetical protein ATSB10_12400 [Dyella thiooxydans]
MHAVGPCFVVQAVTVPADHEARKPNPRRQQGIPRAQWRAMPPKTIRKEARKRNPASAAKRHCRLQQFRYTSAL